MSLIFVDGFDTYQAPLQKWDAQVISGNTGTALQPQILPTSGRSSGGCAYFPSRVNSAVAMLQKNFPNVATMFCGFALFLDTSPASGDTVLMQWVDGSTTQVDLRVTITGHFYFTRNGTILGTQSVNAIPLRAWHYVEVLVTIDPSAGVCTLNVDGTNAGWISLTAQNTRATANSFVGGLKIGYNSQVSGTGFQAPNVFVDDFYLANTTGSFNTAFLGDVRIQGLVPSGNGCTLNYTMQAAAWAASTTKGLGQTILDSNSNLQRVTAVATDAKTGGSPPTWATVAGTTTVDNHVTWTCLGAQAQYLQVAQNPPEGSAVRLSNTAYVIGQMVWDNNGNLQLCTTAGTVSSADVAGWNTTPGGTTTDGTVVWTNLGPGEDTYLLDSTVSDISRFTFPAVTASAIKAAVMNLRVRKDDVSTRSVRGAIKSSATLGDTGTDLVLSLSYATLQGISESDPNTSAAWTPTALNAAEFGIKTTA